MSFLSRNPYTGETLSSFPSLTSSQLVEKLACASRAQKNWQKMSLAQRSVILKEFARQLDANKSSLAQLATLEMGKPITQAEAEISKCVRLCQYYAQSALDHLATRYVQEADLRAQVCFDPLGTILGIMPWNFPYWQALRFAVPTLLAGNAVLLKPAPQVPQSSLAMERILQAILPEPDLFQMVFAETSDIPELIADPRLHGVALTGSDRAGSAVAEVAGKYLKPVILELGGTDPFLVLEDADLERAADTALRSRMNNNGQTCIAAKRILVAEGVLSPFLAAVKERLQQLPTGDPLGPDSFFSCLSRPEIAAEVQGQLEDALQRGAEMVVPGGLVPGSQTRFTPTVLVGGPEDMRIRQEEVFGPVMQIIPFTGVEEGLAIANQTRYGLGASIWTSDLAYGTTLARILDCGTVSINGLVRSDPRVPFGGVKDSGFGRELGPEGIRTFTNVRTILLPS